MNKNDSNLELINDVATLKRFSELNKVNSQLKTDYQKTTMENGILQNALNDKFLSLFARKKLVEQAIKKYGLSIRQACRLFKISRSAYYYESQKSNQDEAEKRLMELAIQYPNLGYWKYYAILRDEGQIINHKRVYRIYKQKIYWQRCRPAQNN